MSDAYTEFLASKKLQPQRSGIEPRDLPVAMLPHQKDATAFCLRAGRAGLFLETGLGKTLCEIEWAAQAAQATNGKALILTPLAVAKQFEREAAKFNRSDVRVIRDQSEAKDGINVCNYDRLDKQPSRALFEFGQVA